MVCATTKRSMGDLREFLVEGGLEIFQKFERQFTNIVDKDQSSWERGIEKLAVDTVSRVMNYIPKSEKEVSINLITKGVVLGESKTKGLLCTPGYEILDKRSGKTLQTTELYNSVGVKGADGEYYQYDPEEFGCGEVYSYRSSFAWELEEWEKVKEKYVPILPPKDKEEYEYILDDERKEKLASSILKEINGEGLAQKKRY